MFKSRPSTWKEVFRFPFPFGHADDAHDDYLGSLSRTEPPTCGKALYRFVNVARQILPACTSRALKELEAEEEGNTGPTPRLECRGREVEWELPPLLDAALRLAVDQTDRESLNRWMSPVLDEARSLQSSLEGVRPANLVCRSEDKQGWLIRAGRWQGPFGRLCVHIDVLLPIAMSRLIDEVNAGPVESGPASPRDPGASVFKKEGANWLVAFIGQEARPLDRKGLHDIQHLLRRPHRAFGGIELQQLEGAGDRQRVSVGHASSAGLTTDAYWWSEQDSNDPAGRAKLQEHARDLIESLKDERNLYKPDELDRMENERDALLRRLELDSGIRGKARSLGTSGAKRAKKAVEKRIAEAITDLRVTKRVPHLVDHLQTCIRWSGLNVSYTPSIDVNWEF